MERKRNPDGTIDENSEKVCVKQTRVGKDGKTVVLRSPENESQDGNGRWIKGK